eukprot:TRINITY_DN16053_c0_g1_i2.p1 TRINITY_DN16053_c0_g1~~TRINITY_DN16053_c0_g1_i2.p1  ORF type:complete len:875 (+),score=168.21 TRINITY_DN16053_c0_g1_i2:71-2695(+)
MISDGLISVAASGCDTGSSQAVTEYGYCKDIDLAFRVKIENLEGCILEELGEDAMADIYVMLELYSNGLRICPEAFSAKCKSRCRHTSAYHWKDTLVFPISYCDLPLDTLLCCTVWSSTSERPVGGTSCYVFSTKGQLKRGIRRLALHKDIQADGSEPSSTLGKITDSSFMAKTNKAMLKFHLGQMKTIQWLDRLTFQEINSIKKQLIHQEETPTLSIEFHIFPVPLYHQALGGPVPQSYTAVPSSGLVTIRDPEIDVADNPCEIEAARIMKSQHLVVDPDLKPNSTQYAKIQSVLKDSSLKSPSQEDTHLLWQFRYFLQKNKIGFTKFMRCVDWSDPKEEAMALELIPKWGGLTLEDCLELFGAAFKGITPVRAHSVDRLGKEPNETLITVLLQLVQAFRYEADPLTSSLLKLLLERSAISWDLCNYFYWYLQVETEDPIPETAAMYKAVQAQLVKAIQSDVNCMFHARLKKQIEFMRVLANVQEKAAAQKVRGKMKATAMQVIKEGQCGVSQLFSKPGAGDAGGAKDHAKTGLTSFGKSIKASMANLGGYSKTETVEEPPAAEEESVDNPKITAPIFPEVDFIGMRDDDVHFFKSAKKPMALSFTRPLGNPPVRIMYKSGDDIRQDQLVQQIVGLIDTLLKQDGLDLMLTPYKCLATSINEGMVELVPDVVPLQEVIGSIHEHLRRFNRDEKGEFQLSKECLDTWVRSNAGYAIITFVLGIGDRHLENLLVTNDGRIVHIDFGFILGRDPKPFPPPLKLRKEMVDAMGGTESARFNEFKKLCCGSFNIIRKHAALIINMMAMMVDANIPDLTSDIRTTKNPYAKIQAVEDKMRLDLNDAEATNYFLDILNEALNSIFSRIGDWAHIKAGRFK